MAVSKAEENDALIAARSANQTECDRNGENKKLDVKQDQLRPVELTVTAALSALMMNNGEATW